MNIFLKSSLAAIVVAGLCYFILSREKTKSYNATISLGIDKLKSGRSTFNDSEIPQLFEMINSRASSICNKWNVKFNNSRKFEVELTDVNDTTGLTEVFTSIGSFGIWEMYTLNQVYSAFEAADKIILASGIDSVSIEGPDTSSNNLLSEATQEYVRRKSLSTIFERGSFGSDNNPELGMLKQSDKADLLKLLQIPEVTHMLPKDIHFVYGKPSIPNKKNDPLISLYAIKTYNRPKHPFLSNKDVKKAYQDFDPATSKPLIQFELKQAAARIWEKLTERNVDRPLAIVMDDKLISAPRVLDKIIGGRSQIAGDFSIAEAKTIASQLNSNPLPVPLAINSLKLSENNPLDKRTLLILSAFLILGFGLAYLVFYLIKPPVNKQLLNSPTTKNLP